MSANSPAGSPTTGPTKGLDPQVQPESASAKPSSPDTRKLSIAEIQAAAKQVVEMLSPGNFSTFYKAKEEACEKEKEPTRLEPSITRLYFTPEDVIQIMLACQGVTWKIRDDAERGLQTRWGLLGTSVPDEAHTVPFNCIPASVNGDSKVLSFTIV